MDWPIPEEINDYLLCQLFHCLPDELDRQDSIRISKHAFIDAEVQKIRAKKEGRSLGGTSKPEEVDEFYKKPEGKQPEKKPRDKKLLKLE